LAQNTTIGINGFDQHKGTLEREISEANNGISPL
jgi:hypothetical protein